MALVIVTRAEPGADETALRLKAMGYDVLKLPALHIAGHELQPDWTPEPDEIIIFTSANGVRCAMAAGWPVANEIICVGPATTEAAHAAGFTSVRNADGNSDDILKLISALFQPHAAPSFVHVANDAAAGDLVRRLGGCGYSARFVPLYGALPVPWADVKDDWPEDMPEQTCILVHSAKAGDVVRGWLEQGKITTERLRLVSVSDRTTQTLSGFQWGASVTASRPNEMKLMEALHLTIKPGV